MIWEIDEKKQTIEGLDASGRPDPAYAAALGLLRAPFGRRALALTLDVALWLLLQLPLWLGAMPLLFKLATGSISSYGFLNHPGFVLGIVMAGVTVLLTLVFSVVQLVLHGTKGLTIGKAIVGIRSVNVRTLGRPGVGAVLSRFLLVAVVSLVPLFGLVLFLISPTLDPQRRGRGWHDKATNVWLVDVRKGLQPYDEKRMRVARKMVKAEPAPERSALPSLATPMDPAAQPEYRPGNRVSAGVIGIARPYEARERPVIGLPQPVQPAEAGPGEAGKPVLGGYRLAGAPEPVQAPVPPPAPAPEPAPEPMSDPAPIPQPAPAPEPAPQTTPAARFALRLDTGESILVSEAVLLGRNPDPAQYFGARPIPLADDSRSLSKTHLLVRPVDGGLEIVDCGSTNGSGLIRDGVEYVVAAGTPVMTTDSDLIRIGDRTAAVIRI
ncbi:RDD family protein [Microbacterium sp. A93]|uniref:RDD family protein n=1 Tax=Microbacterium sp. A93 TaxID=3450716 RepID=UPI003F43BB3C